MQLKLQVRAHKSQKHISAPKLAKLLSNNLPENPMPNNFNIYKSGVRNLNHYLYS